MNIYYEVIYEDDCKKVVNYKQVTNLPLPAFPIWKGLDGNGVLFNTDKNALYKHWINLNLFHRNDAFYANYETVNFVKRAILNEKLKRLKNEI